MFNIHLIQVLYAFTLFQELLLSIFEFLKNLNAL